MRTSGNLLRAFTLAMAILCLGSSAQAAVSYSVGGTGPFQLPSDLIPPESAPWGPNGYPGDTVQLNAFTGSLDLTPGSYVKQINTLSWTIDYTYGGTPEPWPDLVRTFDVSRGITVDGTGGSLSQSAQLTNNYDNDYLSMLLGATTTLFVGGYRIDVTPLGFESPAGGQFPDPFDPESNPWVQPDLVVMARFDVTAADVPEPASIVVWSLIGLTVGGFSWWRRRRPTTPA